MTKREKKQLLKEIAQVAEKAFRRGFQQGHLAAQGKIGDSTPTDEQVYRWRFAKHSKTHSVCPPGTPYAGERNALLDRLQWELCGLDAISRFIHDVKKSDKDGTGDE